MAARRKAEIVDGYTALRAAQRVEKHSGVSKAAGPEASSERAPTSSEGSLGAKHIHRTVQPPRFELTCYECGFRFKLAGRPKHTHCPKCRGHIDLGDHVIEGPWQETLRTGGKIHVCAGAVVTGGELVAGDLLLEGRLEGGRVVASHLLSLGPGAQFALKDVDAQDIHVHAGAEIRIGEPASFRNVTLEGRLVATLSASGMLAICAGGCFEGRFEGAHVRVDEGGGLIATLDVRPKETL